MSIDIRETSLLIFLKGKESALYGKVIELREAIEAWLSYIPQTFPHYTRHTVQHSDEIIRQISHVLFRDNCRNEPSAALSAMEAYILCAAAYLHDAGMVASDQEKAAILQSETWREWVADGAPGGERWKKVGEFRAGNIPGDTVLRNFLADIQLRFLIADFVRRFHHSRAQALLARSQSEFGRFALDDQILLETIADVCASHGLEQRELDDRDRYPQRRDIRGYQVNVQFLAILLRLGDLLDMSTDRACPLLLNAACPLPADSLAHWTQFKRLRHFLSSPDRIEITALCENQEEHRVIKDWCSWLVGEASNGTVLMARSTRHGGWQAPTATMEGEAPTIKIEPAPAATYIPSNWRFELDHELIFRRLVDDLYTEPLSFIRELIQNALDATRCQLYLQLRSDSIPTPEFPTQVPEELRRQYPVRVTLESRKVKNQLSGEVEENQVLAVEDLGIGMDRNVIEKYLLQVGRSFYTTAEFQKSFRFVPTSRFGIGFLSVFHASDHVTIETHKGTSDSGPLRLVLTGPRNYILLEKGARRTNGTRIEVALRMPLQSQEVTKAVSSWCRRVEFPVIVQDLGTETTIVAERKEEFTYEVPDIVKENARFAVRAFEIQRHGLEGELYVFVRRQGQREEWDAWSEARYSYPKIDPRATSPRLPPSLRCIQGISVGEHEEYEPHSQRIDFRGGYVPVPGLSREEMRHHYGRGPEQDPRITSRWIEVLSEHLADCERAGAKGNWEYKQTLADLFPPEAFWAVLPGTIPLHSNGQLDLVSLNEFQDVPVFATTVAAQRPDQFFFIRRELGPDPIWTGKERAIFISELRRLSKAHIKQMFVGRGVESVSWMSPQHLVITWGRADGAIFAGPWYRPLYLADLPSSFTIGFAIHPTANRDAEACVLNSTNPFVAWLISVKNACQQESSGIPAEAFATLEEMFSDCCHYPFHIKKLAEYIANWEKATDLPQELRPPATRLSGAMFARVPQPERDSRWES